jgi:hypothetical protein
MMDMERPQSRPAPAAIAVCLLCALLLYPVSIGPACAAVNNGYLSEQAVETAYAPITWLAERSSAVQSLGNWWIGLWEQ